MTEPQVDDQGRPEPPYAADEIGTLAGFLDYQRATLEWKTRGLGDEGLRARLHPTAMTLGGLLKHLANVEDFWFAVVLGHQPWPEPWRSEWPDDDETWDWTSAADDSPEQLRELWQAKVTHSRQILDGLLAAGPQALSQTHPAWGGRAHVSLRWVLTHMIEEYARHNGHADLLREAVDGETGE